MPKDITTNEHEVVILALSKMVFVKKPALLLYRKVRRCNILAKVTNNDLLM